MSNKERLEEIARQLPPLVERLCRPTLAKSIQDRDRIQQENLSNPPLLQVAVLVRELKAVVDAVLQGKE